MKRAESSSIQGVIQESADNIAAVASRSSKIFTDAITGLSKEDLTLLKRSKKGTQKLTTEVEEMRDNIFYFIKNLDESSVGASNFYITALSYLQDMSQSLEFIGKASYKHVNNNHRKLKFNQTRELLELQQEMQNLFNSINTAFTNRDFDAIETILQNKDDITGRVAEKVQKQIARTRTEESSPKNTSLYFSLLMETKDLTAAVMNLMELYSKEYDSRIPAAEVTSEAE
jgi:Na+/phosphate symporter